jgi:hypothetical protein
LSFCCVLCRFSFGRDVPNRKEDGKNRGTRAGRILKKEKRGIE